MNKSFFSLLVFVLTITLFSACKKDGTEYAEKSSLKVEFENIAGGQSFEFGKYYVTAAGDSIQFSTFNYFVSNFVLVKEDGSEYVVPKNDCYFLVKHEDENTHVITLNNIPGGKYTTARFIIGVDSLMSATDAAQRPASLDPVTNAADMYWAWNSGYIFVKIEGTSPQAPVNAGTQERSVVYHIGGYGGNDPANPTMNNIKTVSLAKAGESAEVGLMEDGTAVVPEMHVLVDILEVFKNPNSFKVADQPVMHWGPFSSTLANNYSDMISLDHIHN